ncbi:MAG: phage tail protein, partial [Bacteroidia bacterium]|nr:phage tail protein [Bacteroidia bacterium]
GQQTFGLPDLRGRTPVGSGQGPGLSPIDEGQSGGQESITMITPNMPIHNHTATGVNVTANVTPKAYSTAGTTDSPNGGYLASMAGLYTGPASDDLKMANQTVTGTLQLGMSATGANQPFSNRSPFLGMNFIICVNGIFPSRN